MTTQRHLTALLLVVVAATVYLFAGGVMLPGCLGPLGVTFVECYARQGMTPSEGLGLPVAAVLLGIALVVVVPIPRRAVPAALMAALALSAIAVGAYLVLRPRTLEGSSSTGAWIVIALPPDGAVLVAAAVVGAFAGPAAVGVVWRLRGAKPR